MAFPEKGPEMSHDLLRGKFHVLYHTEAKFHTWAIMNKSWRGVFLNLFHMRHSYKSENISEVHYSPKNSFPEISACWI